jgi:hypothetical protein
LLREEKPDLLSRRIAELRAGLAGIDPASLARRTGSVYVDAGEESAFHLAFWGRQVNLSFPGFVARDVENRSDLPVLNQALLLYYFSSCDGEPAAGRWISYSELPDGRFYNQAFQGYTGMKLVQAFGDDLDAFCRAAGALGGLKTQMGDVAFAFQALPNVPLLAVYWLGDEDFPPSCQILFDAAVSHHLPTDACAILGSGLAHRLIRQKDEHESENFDRNKG